MPEYIVSVYSTCMGYITLLLYWNQPYSYEMIYYPPSSPVIPILNWKWLEFTVTLTQLHFQSGTWQIFPVVYLYALYRTNCKLQISFKNRFSAPYDLNLIYFQAVNFMSFAIVKCPSQWGKNNSAESLLILCMFVNYAFKGA